MALANFIGKATFALNSKSTFGIMPPAQLPVMDGLSLWLDATTGLYDATTGGNLVTSNDSAISRWEDMSGNERHIIQPTANNKPVLKAASQNGNNTVYFDGSNDWLYGNTNDGFFNTLPRTTFFVVKLDTKTTRTEFFGNRGGTLGDGDTGGQVYGFNNPADTAFTSNIAKGAINFSQSTAISQTWGIYVNKTTSTDINYYRYGGGSNSTTVGYNNGFRIKVGSGQGNDYFFQGNVAEITSYSRILTNAEISSMETYFTNKWGV